MISHNVGYRVEKFTEREQHGIDFAPTTGPSENLYWGPVYCLRNQILFTRAKFNSEPNKALAQHCFIP